MDSDRFTQAVDILSTAFITCFSQLLIELISWFLSLDVLRFLSRMEIFYLMCG